MTEPTTKMAAGPDNRETYAVEDAQAILQIAIARQTEAGEELTRSQLLEIGEELGLTATTLTEAEQEWQLKRSEDADLHAFDAFRKERFQSHLLRFVLLNGVLLSINFLTLSKFSWALYVLLVWGAAIGMHAWQTYQPNQLRHRADFEKWRRRQQLKRSFGRLVNWLVGP